MTRRRFLAVDVGGTDVKWAVAGEGGLGEVRRVRTRRDTAGELVDQLSGLHADASGGEPLPWALCIAGLVDSARGLVVRSGNLGLENDPLADQLAETGARPELIVNDVTAAAAGEADGESLALLQLGSGVAGRIVVDGTVVTGLHGYGGELGHLVFVPGGRPCACGLAGCIEAYAGMARIRDRYAELGRAAPSPQRLLADAAADPDAAAIVEDAFRAAAFAAAVLVSAADPGTLRLGGGVATAWGEQLRTAVERGIADRLVPEISGQTRIELSRFGERGPLLGLLHLAGVT
jgi:glucokinase